MKLAIHGAAGRMGQRVVALASQSGDFQIVAALEAASHPLLGRDAGLVAGVEALHIPLAVAGESDADVVVDFSLPDAAVEIVDYCLGCGKPLVIATTGFDAQQRDLITRAAEKLPIVMAPSMSMAVNLAMKLAVEAGRTLRKAPGGADVEIIERHHRFKEDAPSGTALRFAELIADAMDLSQRVDGRTGRPGPRPDNEIGCHAIRAGDNPGEHTVVFGLLGETLELRVAATSRDCYAQGALMAARWLLGKRPGMYDMNDVLGL